MQHISTFFKENTNLKHRAEVFLDNGIYQIHYYNNNGDLFQTENFQGRSLHYVEDAAENWALGVKVLNG